VKASSAQRAASGKGRGPARRSPLAARLTVLVILALPQIAMACPVCYGDPNSLMAKGMNNAILFLLGVVGFVQIGFVALFWSWWRRARQMRRQREQLRVIEGGSR
jgi:hypothetical protein